MATTQDLRVRYVGDTTGVRKSTRELDSMHASLGQRFKQVGASMARTGSTLTRTLTLPVVAFGAVASREFSEVVAVNAQTEAALRSTGGAAGLTKQGIQDLSAEIGTLSALDAELVQESNNVLLTFTKIRNEAGAGNDIFDQASLAVANLSARLGKDLNSSAIMVGKALNDPVLGMTALSRAGVQFTEQQKNMITRLVESGDVLGAQKVILSELETEFAGSAKAAGQAASPMTRVALAFNDMAEMAGQFLVPVLQKVASWFSSIAEAFRSLSPETQKLIITIAGIAAAVGPVLIIFGKLVSAIGGIISIAGKLGALANPWVLLGAAIAAVAVLVIRNWDAVKGFVVKAFNAIKGAALPVWEAIRSGVVALWAVVGPIAKAFRAVFGLAFKAIGVAAKLAFKIVWGAVKVAWAVVGPIAKAFLAAFKVVFDGIAAAAKLAWGLVGKIVKTAWGVIREIGRAIGGFFKDIWNGIADVAKGVWNGILATVKAVVNTIIGLVNRVIDGLNWLWDKIPDFLLPENLERAAIPHIPTLGAGGIVTRPTLALVGERGPEAIVPLRGGGGATVKVMVSLDRRRFGRSLEHEYVGRGW